MRCEERDLSVCSGGGYQEGVCVCVGDVWKERRVWEGVQ